MQSSICQVEIPVSIFCYKSIDSSSDYKLIRIFRTTSSLEICDSLIKRRKLDVDMESDIQFFDAIHIPDMNRKSILFMLIQDTDERIVCRPCSDVGPLRLEILPMNNTWANLSVVQDESLYSPTAELSFSVYSASHHFSETQQGLLVHDSFTVVPCTSVFIPLYLTNRTLHNFLTTWHKDKMQTAISKTIFTATFLNRCGFLKTLYSSSQRHNCCFHFKIS